MSRLTDLAGVLGGALGVPVILSHQKVAGAPRPADVYGTVRFTRSEPAGPRPRSFMVKGSGVKTRTERRHAIAILDVYGDGATDLIEALSHSLHTAANSKAARDLGLNLQSVDVVLEAPILKDTEHEEHAQTEIRVQYIRTSTEAIERIETAEVSIEVKDAAANTLETVVVTAP